MKTATEKMNDMWVKAKEKPLPQKETANNTDLEKRSVTFSFLLQYNVVQQLREIELLKRQTDFHYNVSDVIREGIEVMKKKYTDLPIRPNGVLPTRRGKHSNSDKKEKFHTSCRISEEQRDFIYDFMFSKNIDENGQIKAGNFTKDDFVEALLKDLKATL